MKDPAGLSIVQMKFEGDATRHILSSMARRATSVHVHMHRMRRPSRKHRYSSSVLRWAIHFFRGCNGCVTRYYCASRLMVSLKRSRSPSLKSVPIYLTASLSWKTYPVQRKLALDHDPTPRHFLSPSSLDCITLSDSYTHVTELLYTCTSARIVSSDLTPSLPLASQLQNNRF
jgi:hypothetical protein